MNATIRLPDFNKAFRTTQLNAIRVVLLAVLSNFVWAAAYLAQTKGTGLYPVRRRHCCCKSAQQLPAYGVRSHKPRPHLHVFYCSPNVHADEYTSPKTSFSHRFAPFASILVLFNKSESALCPYFLKYGQRADSLLSRIEGQGVAYLNPKISY
jgi:hypothetical protein